MVVVVVAQRQQTMRRRVRRELGASGLNKLTSFKRHVGSHCHPSSTVSHLSQTHTDVTDGSIFVLRYE